MNSAISLMLAVGVTAGCMFGLPAVVLLPMVTFAVVVLAGQRPLVLVTVALVGGLVGHARVVLDDIRPLQANVASATQIEGTVDSVPRVGPSGERATIEVTHVRTEEGGEWEESGGRLLVFFRDTVESGVMRGDQVLIRGSVQDSANLDPDFRRFVRSEGASGVAWVYAATVSGRGDQPFAAVIRLRGAITRRILDAVPADAGALIAGFVTGDDSHLSQDARIDFELTNTSHITAVSGGNVAILLAMWGLLIPEGRFRRYLVVQVALVFLIWGYVGLVGFGPAALRAGLFATLLIPATRFGRKADPMTSLFLASAILLLINPALADSVGFWLSMSASAALVTVVPVGGIDRALNIQRILMGLIAAQLATLPISFWIFDPWSPASFVANLIIGPLVSILMPVAFVFAALLLVTPLFGSLLGWIPGMGAEIILASVRSMSDDFPNMRSGPITNMGVVLISLFCAVVIAVFSVDFRRWIHRIEFAHRNGSGRVATSLIGVAAGVAIGLLISALR